MDPIYNGFEGESRNGVPNGYGTITFPNGNRYMGRWVNGKRTGFGQYFYSNGSRYEGEVHEGHLHGRGVLTFANGNHYEGEFRYGKREGRGVFTWHDGEKYEGGFLNDKRDGYGVYYYANRDVYKGKFSNGLKHGYGVYYYSNGDRYEGYFKEGQRHGSGTLQFNNGDRYEGEFKNDKQNGIGLLTEANSNKYEGKFKNDRKHGDGIAYIKEEKAICIQKWKMGLLLSSHIVSAAHLLDNIMLSEVHRSKLALELQKPVPMSGDLTLPYNVTVKIFSFLDVRSLCLSCLVCSDWRRVAESNLIWEDLVRCRWPVERQIIKQWKRTYHAKLKTFSGDVIKHGTGRYVFKNVNEYEGEWYNNLRHGYGRMLYFSNCGALDTFLETYEGNWKKGKKSGLGRYVYSNGDRFEGMFEDGKMDGHGVLVLINGDRYEGKWKDFVLSGSGKCIKAVGSVYEGGYVNGEKEGFGAITYDNGNRYEGKWKDGNKHGLGVDIFANGTRWEGEYTNGKKNENIYIAKDQALELDWRDVFNEERVRARKQRIKRMLMSYSSNGKKKRRKKPPFVMPEMEVMVAVSCFPALLIFKFLQHKGSPSNGWLSLKLLEIENLQLLKELSETKQCNRDLSRINQQLCLGEGDCGEIEELRRQLKEARLTARNVERENRELRAGLKLNRKKMEEREEDDARVEHLVEALHSQISDLTTRMIRMERDREELMFQYQSLLETNSSQDELTQLRSELQSTHAENRIIRRDAEEAQKRHEREVEDTFERLSKSMAQLEVMKNTWHPPQEWDTVANQMRTLKAELNVKRKLVQNMKENASKNQQQTETREEMMNKMQSAMRDVERKDKLLTELRGRLEAVQAREKSEENKRRELEERIRHSSLELNRRDHLAKESRLRCEVLVEEAKALRNDVDDKNRHISDLRKMVEKKDELCKTLKSRLNQVCRELEALKSVISAQENRRALDMLKLY
ncbi:MORN repeat variant family protein [Planoprotostelium fungivorum]|uniref:MORN repeat variant family protein n=1 Tax=Planoprotostelium fungivorum TaxID=1890364 RepID=A0A2P6NMF1_9EUKA|nr:MORN repeat variant family protein [Planoprotostelium fungivorum]